MRSEEWGGGRAGEAADTELKTKTPHVNVGKKTEKNSAAKPSLGSSSINWETTHMTNGSCDFKPANKIPTIFRRSFSGFGCLQWRLWSISELFEQVPSGYLRQPWKIAHLWMIKNSDTYIHIHWYICVLKKKNCSYSKSWLWRLHLNVQFPMPLSVDRGRQRHSA